MTRRVPRVPALLLVFMMLIGGLLHGMAARLVNAAMQQNGARIDLSAGPGVRKDARTEPEATFDGNIHTRQVITGVPYTFTIELADRLPIETIAFAHSDYTNEVAPRELEITLDDGPPIRHSLELKRPDRRKPAWQEKTVATLARTVKITVLTNHQPSDKVNWGGLGEIAIWTSADLSEKFRIPGYNSNAPVFVHIPQRRVDGAPVLVNLPPRARAGDHPCLLFTPAELVDFRKALGDSERGREALRVLRAGADAALGMPLEFPDPSGPQAQMKDRGDAVARQHDRLSLNCGTLGFAYALTGETKYAQRAREILIGYSQRYASYPEHRGVNRSDTGKVMGQRLSEAMWLIPLIEAYDYIKANAAGERQQQFLTVAEQRQVETELIRPAIAFIRRKDPDAEVAARDKANPDWRTAPKGKSASNWLLFYNTATMMAGAVMNDRNLIDLAAGDFRELIRNGIGDDGMWGEGAIGYQFFAMSAMVPGLETAARQGIDLWSFADARVKMLFDSPLRYAYPDGSAPGINDSGRARFGNWSTMSYDYAWLRYGDPAHAFLVNASPRQLQFSQAVYFPTRIYERLSEPETTRYPSTVFENLGYAILRNTNVYALVDYGKHGGVHGHYDKLNLILFGRGTTRGDELGGEPVFHRYEEALHGEWTRHTVAHNTMAVDQRSQQPSQGKLLVFEHTPSFSVARAEASGAYVGVLLDRTVVVMPEGVLDMFHGRSAAQHTWDRTFRHAGALDQIADYRANGTRLGSRDGFQHVSIVSQGRAETGGTDAGAWRGMWRTSAGPFATTIAAAPRQQVFVAAGPDQEQMAMARQKGTNSDVAAFYQLDSWPGALKRFEWISLSGSVRACKAETMIGATISVFVSHDAQSWEMAGWSSNARVLCVRESGGLTELLMCGGTFARRRDLSVSTPASGNVFASGAKALSVMSAWSPAGVSDIEGR